MLVLGSYSVTPVRNCPYLVVEYQTFLHGGCLVHGRQPVSSSSIQLSQQSLSGKANVVILNICCAASHWWFDFQLLQVQSSLHRSSLTPGLSHRGYDAPLMQLCISCTFQISLNTGISSFLQHTADVLKLLNKFIQCSSTTSEGSTSSDHIKPPSGRTLGPSLCSLALHHSAPVSTTDHDEPNNHACIIANRGF